MQCVSCHRNSRNSQEALPLITSQIRSGPFNSVIMVDGHPFSGKSSLAKLLHVELDGIHIETDNFLLEHRTKDSTYQDSVDLLKVDEAVRTGIKSGKYVIVDGLCLDWIVSKSHSATAFRIYMKHNCAYTKIDDERTRSRFGTDRYHELCNPEENASVIISWSMN